MRSKTEYHGFTPVDDSGQLRMGQQKMSLKPEALALLLDGVDLHGARMRPWYQR